MEGVSYSRYIVCIIYMYLDSCVCVCSLYAFDRDYLHLKVKSTFSNNLSYIFHVKANSREISVRFFL
jgi:hypothetical protein